MSYCDRSAAGKTGGSGPVGGASTWAIAGVNHSAAYSPNDGSPRHAVALPLPALPTYPSSAPVHTNRSQTPHTLGIVFSAVMAASNSTRLDSLTAGESDSGSADAFLAICSGVGSGT